MALLNCLPLGPCAHWRLGWGIVFFARDKLGSFWLLGATRGPTAISRSSPYVMGAQRATSPVAELAAPIIMLRMLRASQIALPLHWCTDSTYAEGLVKGTQTELALVNGMRK